MAKIQEYPRLLFGRLDHMGPLPVLSVGPMHYIFRLFQVSLEWHP